jgi:hypothetical protein
MPSYRVYWLNARRRILRGNWIQARDDDDARRKASTLCEPDTASIEVWEAARPVGEVECD